MAFARAAPPVYNKIGNCYAGRKQTNYPIRWTQANQLSNKLTISNRRLEGQPGGLQSGFALYLVWQRAASSLYLICIVPVIYNWPTYIPPPKLPLPVENPDLHLIRGSFGIHQSGTANGISIGSSTFAQLTHVPNTQTHRSVYGKSRISYASRACDAAQ